MRRQEEEPSKRVRSPGRRGGPHLSALIAQVGQDRVRFPECKITIGEHRNTTVWIERKELRPALFAFRQIDRDDLAFEPQLEQRETDLLRIGGRKMIKFHRSSPPIL